MDIYSFIDTYKVYYNKWLKNTFKAQYPVICDISSDILTSYLVNSFKDNNIKFISGTFNNNYHCWIEIDNDIIDFTLIQFISDYDINKPIIDKKYHHHYNKAIEHEPSFTDIAGVNSFDMYLSKIK